MVGNKDQEQESLALGKMAEGLLDEIDLLKPHPNDDERTRVGKETWRSTLTPGALKIADAMMGSGHKMVEQPVTIDDILRETAKRPEVAQGLREDFERSYPTQKPGDPPRDWLGVELNKIAREGMTNPIKRLSQVMSTSIGQAGRIAYVRTSIGRGS